MYHMGTMLSLILLVSEMMKIPRAKVEAHFLKKLAFVTNKCLAQDAFGKCLRTTENLSKYTMMRECRVFYKSILVIELYRLPRCIAPYKQSLS